MKQIVTIISALTTLFFVQTVSAQENFILPEGSFEELTKDGTAYVDEAVSPLTLRLKNGKFIHLAGLDIPDYNVHDPGEYAQTARDILNDFLKGQQIILYKTKSSSHGRINRMGHYIVHIARADDNIWVQGMLTSLGIARVRTTKYNPEMARQLYELEKHAREQKHGIWSVPEYQILSPQKADKHIGSYQIVEGRIRNVSMHKNTIYLNFGQNWREDFTISIASTNFRKFQEHGINPQTLGGKNIRVRGWLNSYNGPHIKVDHPQPLEILNAPKASRPKTLKGSALPAPSNIKKSSKNKKATSALPQLND